MPHTARMLRFTLALVAALTAMLLLGGGHGWWLTLGVGLAISVVYWAWRDWRSVADDLWFWPFKPSLRVREATAILMLTAIGILLVAFALAARLS